MNYINERYRVIEKIKTDAFGDILLVEDLKYERISYMRLFLVEFSQSDLIKHFKTKFVHYSTMIHPNLSIDYKFDVITSIDHKKSSRTQFFYVYERCSHDLLNYMDLSRQEAMEVLVEVCKALRYIHFRGYVYKYLSFDNIHIYRDDNNNLKIKLTDLASLQLYKDHFKQERMMNQFIAPEIFWKESHNIQADIYSLGIVFYYLYHRTSYKSRIVDESLRKNIKNGVDRVVAQMIRVSVVDEITSVKEFLAVIEEMLNIFVSHEDYEYYNRLQLKAPILERFNESKYFPEIVKSKFERQNDFNALIVVGDMGTGKSRVLDEAEMILRWEGHRVLRVNCSEELCDQYGVFKRILKEIITYGDLSQELIMKYGSELVKLLPECEEAWNLHPAEALDGSIEQLRIKNRLHHFLREYSIVHHLVIILDGIHMLDNHQMDLIEYLFNDQKENQFFIIASYENDNLLSSNLAQWDQGKKIITKYLTNFNYDEASNFVSSVLGVGYNPIELTAKVMREAHGNQKIIKEMLITLFEKKYIFVSRGDEWVLHDHFDEFDHEHQIKVLPNHLEVLNDLNLNEIKVLELVSLFNEAAPLDCIVSLIPQENLNVSDVLKTLTKNDILKMKFDDLGETYDFCSRSLKRAVQDKIDKSVKEKLHYDIAIYFENRIDKDGYQYMDLIIHHFSNGNNKEKAVKYCDQLAENMKEKHMYMQAIELYNRGLGLLHTGERTAEIARHYYEVGYIYDLVGESELSKNILYKGLEISQEFKDKETDIKCRLLLAKHYILRRDLVKAQNHLNLASEFIEYSKDQSVRYDLHEKELLLLMSENNIFEANALIASILEDAKGEHKARLLNINGILTLYDGHLNEAIQWFQKSLKAYESVVNPHPINALLPLNNIGAIYAFYMDDLEKGRAYFERGRSLLESKNLSRGSGVFTINLGETYLIENQPEKAFELFEKVIAIADKIMDVSLRTDVSRFLCTLYLQQENYQKSFFYLKKLESEYEDFNHNVFVDVNFYLIHAEFYLHIKEFDLASQWCKRLRNSDLSIASTEEFVLRVIEYEIEMYRKQYFNYTEHVDLKFVEVLSKTQSNIVEAKAVRSLIHRLGVNLLNYKKFMDVHYLVKLDEGLKSSFDATIFSTTHRILKEALNHNRIEFYEVLLSEKNSKENLWLIYKFIGDEYYDQYDYYKSIIYYFNAFDVLRTLSEYVPKLYKEAYIFSDEVKLDLKSKINNIYKKLGGDSLKRKTVYSELEIRRAEEFFELSDFKSLVHNPSIQKSILEGYKVKHEIIFESVNDLISNFGKNEIYNIQLILKFCTQLLMGDRGYIFILDEGQNIKEVIKSNPTLDLPDLERILKSSVNINDGLLVNTIYDHKRNYPFLEEQKGLLCIPIIKNEITEVKRREQDFEKQGHEIKGYMYIEAYQAFNNFTKESFDACISLMNMLYFFVDNYHLKKISTIDKLTDVYLRSYFEDLFSKTLQKAKLYNDQLSVVMLDIDKFKAINDTYGHRKGDEILTRMCQVIKNNVRETDLIGRYGGEEFVLVFPGTEKNQAYIICEKIRKAIEGTSFFNEDRNVTISLGIASFPELGLIEEELIEKADQALYCSKNSGRNQTTLWNPDLGETQLRFDKLAGILEGNISTDTRNVQGIVDIMNLLKSPLNIEDSVELVLKTIADVCEAQKISLIQLDDKRVKNIFTKYTGDDRIYMDESVDESFVDKYRQKQTAEHFINWNDVSQTEQKSIPNWRSMIVCPLAHKGQTKGLLIISVPIATKEFGFNTTNFVNAISGVIGSIL